MRKSHTEYKIFKYLLKSLFLPPKPPQKLTQKLRGENRQGERKRKQKLLAKQGHGSQHASPKINENELNGANKRHNENKYLIFRYARKKL